MTQVHTCVYVQSQDCMVSLCYVEIDTHFLDSRNCLTQSQDCVYVVSVGPQIDIK